MKLSPASLLILTMFCSFAVVLTAMVLIFRPHPRPVRQRAGRVQAPEKPPSKQTARPDAGARVAPDTGHAASGTAPQGGMQAAPRAPSPGSRLQSRLEQEQKEIGALRAEMEKRLKEQMAVREKKLAQLAQTCEGLEPGEAVQALQALDDETVAEVLGRLNRDAARRICVLLRRLGRDKAIPAPYRQAKPE